MTASPTMKAVGYLEKGAIERADALLDLDVAIPTVGPRDLLVEVRAISVNPVDTKIRKGVAPATEGTPKIVGWDVAGVVKQVGTAVTAFSPGDRVWYAGSLTRQGANAELHAVDERIVGTMPSSLDFEAAAALPLTAITAWELLFDRLGVAREGGEGKSLLIIGAAGGVGSILVQLARQLTKLRVIGSASREDTTAWIRELGAHDVIDHRRPLSEALAVTGLETVDYVAALTHTDVHFPEIVKLVAPQGRVGVIDDPPTLDVMPLKRKSVSLCWELMFTRSLYETADMIEQQRLLNEVAKLVDAGTLRTTATERFGTIDAATLKRAHALIESGKAKGKIVLAGFPAR